MSEDIKPWTYRQQKQLDPLSPNKQKEMKPVLRDRPTLKNRLASQTDVRATIEKPLQLPLLQPEAILRARRLINEKLAENSGISLSMNEQGNFLPSYKFISISFSNNGSKKSKKNKKVPYHINSLRQYTDNHELRNENDTKNKSSVGHLSKIQRYFTEEKSENKNDCNEAAFQMESCLSKMQKQTFQCRSRNDPSLKLISRNYRSIQQSEKLIHKGALYEEIDKLCNIKCVKSNKLTYMKRTYNLKRLEKILS